MDATILTIFGICFIFFMTCLGASLIFFAKKEKRRERPFLSNLCGGIMLASSFFSLLLPAISSTENYGVLSFLPVCVGFVFGAVFMWVLDLLLNKTKNGSAFQGKRLSKNQKIFIAISLHNIPEGLSVGVALGTAFMGLGTLSMLSAVSLAVGIGIQNIPEGFAVAQPAFEMHGSKPKAFLNGVFSGIVEPIFAVLGFFLSYAFIAVLPWFLAFAGGTMIFTIISELMTENEQNKSDMAIWGFVVGFVIMMLLDVAFG